MAITQARGLAATDIRCECGGVRTVTARQAREWREGRIPGTCVACRGGSSARVARERDIAFWLKAYGVKVPRGQSARAIAASGLPPELAQLAKDAFGP